MKKIITLAFWFFALPAFSQTIGLVPFAVGFAVPLEVTHAGDERLFVVEKEGIIKIVNIGGNINPDFFLQLNTETITVAGKGGLLGLAFHPDYATNGYFYIYYSRALDDANVIARYSVSDDPDIADPLSETILLVIPQPTYAHHGGTMKFGPDGYLYIGTGDGGLIPDPFNSAQDLNLNRGKILRLDVDAPAPYIPAGNPYVDIDGNDEIWARGLRNPWKFSFDRENGDLWIADVGQSALEEIDKVTSPLTPGLNFGWHCYEGTLPLFPESCDGTEEFTLPFTEYSHDDGCSIIGGYVYRGELFPTLTGKYFFTDWCEGKIGMVNDAGVITLTEEFIEEGHFNTFGEDVNGELYIAGGDNLYKIVDLELGIENLMAQPFSIYPNPANHEISIVSSAGTLVKLEVFDLSGKYLLGTDLTSINENINISELSKGMYVARVKVEDGSVHCIKLAKN